MAPISAARRALRQANDLEPRLGGLIGAVPNTQRSLKTLEGGDWFLGCVARAIDASMESRKAAALTMGNLDQGQLSENLKGEGHLSARRLGLMPETFFIALIDEVREHFQIDNDADRLARALKARAACDEVINEIARKGATK
jgi:hypothetical protein